MSGSSGDWGPFHWSVSAVEAVQALKECAAWCVYLIHRCATDQAFKELFAVVNLDMDHDLEVARLYIDSVTKASDLIQGDWTKSTTQQRHDARMLVAQAYTWATYWFAGINFRNGIYSDTIAPSDYNSYKYTSPDAIPTIYPAICDIFPGFDPLADDPNHPNA